MTQANGWNRRAAEVLIRECGLSKRTHPREFASSLRWWKLCREKGVSKGIGDDEIEAAIVGLKFVYGRLRLPWTPYALFCKKNRGLFNEALAAGRKLDRKPKRLATILREIAARD